MLTRRIFITSSAAGLALALTPVVTHAAADDPIAIVNAIYARALKTKNGGEFHEKSVRAKYLAAAFAALWDKAEARTQNDAPGPVEFDPVSNSQDPDIKSFTASEERRSEGRVTVAATIVGHHGKRDKEIDNIIRYDFVREHGAWRIDDIRGAADGDPWSIRDILNDFLKPSGKRGT